MKIRILYVLLLISVLINSYFIVKIIYRKYSEWKYYQSCSIQKQIPNVVYQLNKNQLFDSLSLKPNAVIFVGDSHIQTYPTNEFFPNIITYNRGIGGDNTLGLLNRLQKIVASKPKTIIMEIGINDLLQGTTPETVIANYHKIIHDISASSPQTKIIGLSILPTNWYVYDTQISVQSSIDIVNSSLANINNPNYIFIDLHSKLKDVNNGLAIQYDCGDRLHLNYAAYQVLTNQLLQYL